MADDPDRRDRVRHADPARPGGLLRSQGPRGLAAGPVRMTPAGMPLDEFVATARGLIAAWAAGTEMEEAPARVQLERLGELAVHAEMGLAPDAPDAVHTALVRI